MNDRTLDVVVPIQLKNKLLIPVNANIIKLFGKKQIQFQLLIKDNKIILESPEVLQHLDLQDNNPRQETINV